MTSIDVCICTWKRSALANALRSVDTQDISDDVALSIIIADNDEVPSAEKLVAETSVQIQVPVTYLHAPARNISLARNACLNAASADWIAFLDDDEVAASDWLSKLLRMAEQENLTAVFGPSIATYTEEMPDWIKEKDYHSNWPETRHGIVETGHTCNALMRREDIAVTGKLFDLSKGLTGGEDTDYFFRIWRDGGRFGICPDALVTEPVDPERLTYRWIARRKFRSGQSFGSGAASIGQGERIRIVLLAFLKIIFCLAAAALFFWSETQRNYWSLRAVFHSGVVASFFGTREAELY